MATGPVLWCHVDMIGPISHWMCRFRQAEAVRIISEGDVCVLKCKVERVFVNWIPALPSERRKKFHLPQAIRDPEPYVGYNCA